MLTLRSALRSSVGQKFIMALTGLGLVGFTVAHLLGNLTLLIPGGAAFNRYAFGLERLGVLLEVAEVGLVILFGAHIVTAIRSKISYRRARPKMYSVYRSKGGPSQSNLASMNMIVTGTVLLAFLVFHILHFKFGPGRAEGYVTTLDGVEVRDLHRLVVESFRNPIITSLYVGVMVLLGFHLRHGFWSVFQSLGALSSRWMRPAMVIGAIVAAGLAMGFLFIPLWIYFDLGGLFR